MKNSELHTRLQHDLTMDRWAKGYANNHEVDNDNDDNKFVSIQNNHSA